MSEVTRILALVDDDPKPAEQLLTLVYEELCEFVGVRLNQEQPSHLLAATRQVHEAYLRL